MRRIKAAIIGSGNIGTDLMYKIERAAGPVELVAMAGIDPESEGLARARALGRATTSEGIEGLIALPEFSDVALVYDATSAGAHARHDAALRDRAGWLVDLTPAAIGPFVVPAVSFGDGRPPRNLNMVTCGGQATVPIVAAIARAMPVRYAEIVASIASRSAGPGTRANIDEFTQTTARALREVGGAAQGKAIIILNPAEPPMLMRNTVFCLTDDGDRDAITASVEAMVATVQGYVPGYRLKQCVQFERVGGNAPLDGPDADDRRPGLKVGVFLEVEGTGQYLPRYAGNLDIMTAAALGVGERLAAFA